MSRGIRGYGPGKFNTIIDSLVYEMTTAGMGDESCGDVSEVGFYAEKVTLGDKDALKAVEDFAKEGGEELTPEEKSLIEESVGAIVVENEQGFVSVDYYDDEKELEKDWAEIEDDASADEDEDDEDEGEDEEEESEFENAEEDGE